VSVSEAEAWRSRVADVPSSCCIRVEVDNAAPKPRDDDGSGTQVKRRVKRENKFFIIKGRGSSVVEQPIRKPLQGDVDKRDS